MTVKEIFDLRKQGRIEEAYEAIRPMYRVHKGYYTSLCMYHCAKDVFHLRLAEGRIDEAEKIYQALERLVPFIDDRDGSVAKFMAEASARLAALRSAMPCKGNITETGSARLNALQGQNTLAQGLAPGDVATPQPNPKLQRLLNILKGDMSVREMMAALGFASRDKFLKNYLSPALTAGLIEMTEPDSPKSPKQRYRRTDR